MYGFLTGFNPPESYFIDFKYIIPAFEMVFEKQEFCQN